MALRNRLYEYVIRIPNEIFSFGMRMLRILSLCLKAQRPVSCTP